MHILLEGILTIFQQQVAGFYRNAVAGVGDKLDKFTDW